MRVSLVLLVAGVLTACSSAEGPASPSSAPAPSTRAPSGAPSEARSESEDTGTRIRIGFEGGQVEATVLDTPAGRDLVAQLPLELDMSDHGGVEKTGPLPRELSTDGEPTGADPDVGALGYYAPYGDLVLYYGDQSYFDGIVVLGRMEEGFDALGRIDGNVSVRVEALEQP
ncbi:cyclophilin-like fold protein [Aeromicrobium sp. Leaf291]|uniref:cyclophilin-like fold protein n=1 Tax=Aeromicrobium sp. Leaf291 TaxID=1736325 RepID=UPI0006F91BED|nr:cyclophilin-like fold protein [Aeromicrobium sp. Leaf291]KQP81835.1 hypothetical protein ASF35_10105 [Aeromicrobium sp. Leaf291]